MSFLPTELEIEVADVLIQLSDLWIESARSQRPDWPRWGVRRRRTLLGNESPAANAAAATLAPLDGEATASKKEAASPATPLSFPTSCSDETGSSGRGNASKKRQQGRKDENEEIAMLSAHKVDLEQALVEVRNRRQNLENENVWLKNLLTMLREIKRREAINRRAMMMQQQAQRIGGADVGVAFPAAVRSAGPTQLPERRLEMAARWATAEVGIDLNESAEEMEKRYHQEMERWAAARARKRRLEIQREKSAAAAAAAAAAGGSPVVASSSLRSKLSRLR